MEHFEIPSYDENTALRPELPHKQRHLRFSEAVCGQTGLRRGVAGIEADQPPAGNVRGVCTTRSRDKQFSYRDEMALMAIADVSLMRRKA
jgi:hypothetical protein